MLPGYLRVEAASSLGRVDFCSVGVVRVNIGYMGFRPALDKEGPPPLHPLI